MREARRKGTREIQPHELFELELIKAEIEIAKLSQEEDISEVLYRISRGISQLDYGISRLSL